MLTASVVIWNSPDVKLFAVWHPTAMLWHGTSYELSHPTGNITISLLSRMQWRDYIPSQVWPTCICCERIIELHVSSVQLPVCPPTLVNTLVFPTFPQLAVAIWVFIPEFYEFIETVLVKVV